LTEKRFSLGRRSVFGSLCRPLPRAAAAAMLLAAAPASAEDGVAALLQETHWGETSNELARHFGAAALRLEQPLDFGDSYARIVLPGAVLGGVPMVAFFQMDKKTHGLRRIQLERPPHAANPPALRAIASALLAELGPPQQTCTMPPAPQSGWQAATEARWVKGDAAITGIFRDTTMQALEGCPFGPTTGWCGLHGSLLVRLGPAAGLALRCD
jgi:hypothetical protein